MPASSLAQLYSYDRYLEDAWSVILQEAFDAANLPAPATAYIEQSDDVKNTPFVDVQLRDTQAFDQTRLTQGRPLYNSWQAHLVSRVTTKRTKNSDLQSTLIGIIRAQAANFRDLFTAENLPYHAVLDLKDSGLRRGLLIDTQLDWSEVFFLVKFSVRNDAWPA